MKLSDNYIFLIADDHSVVRQGISLVVKELFSKAVIHTAGSFKETLKIVKDTKLDILILDINFPDGNSINIIPEIKAAQPEVKILIFTAYDESIYAMRYLNAGASGYLNKGCTEEEIRQAVKSMISTGKYVTQSIKDRILDSYISKTPINPLEKLSIREVEVARLLIKGYGNLEISELLQIKKTTVSTFKNRVFEKLEIDNLAALIELFQLYFEDNK
ncbi:MAG TPA: response regulator transcription factor [Flavobacterium sp.]|uniref:response regulator transcription factor n=1 Tax=Flavobacterium sp. TaxID=239 RepID=UPI002C9AA7CE|nr:response regulator transcription factor [Flavobacterium sp.]HNP33818.1 response regulator transcription factor [Flavobacterium sp.]